ncbi:MAG: aldo/keto reductase [Acidobacteria bacterium]|nr:MAG: aldo/keto reductase [Acidobacteriota bacterium]
MFKHVSRRDFLRSTATAAAGSLAVPYFSFGKVAVSKPMTRVLGRTGFEVTTLGLGGQASLQWTPPGVDPVAIIVKAVEQGVNYLDTSNVYGPSQQNFGKAFRALNLVPGLPGYDERRRGSLHLASKTMIRHAKGSSPNVPDRRQGPQGSKAVDDLKRTLSLIFGDGQGNYPDNCYLDLFQIHNLNTMAEADAIFAGLDSPDPQAERIGALAALVDFRDGSNLTGLNPKREKLIRHIGITGHISSPVMIECLQRDEKQIIDTMLIAINANDRRYLNHQYNAIPVAKAKNVGIIAMKVFADGAMYTKDARWSRTPEDVVQVVGTADLPSRPLVEYSLSTPGIATAIIGVGHIDSEGRACQIEQNLSAAQIRAESFSDTDRKTIEQIALRAKQGQTNWFQLPPQPLGPPREVAAAVETEGGARFSKISWQTAYAADEPITQYEIRRDGQPIGRVPHQPQTSKKPFVYREAFDEKAHSYEVVTIDRAGRQAPSQAVQVNA